MDDQRVDRDAIVAAFDIFRKELDEYNDARERLIKLSREVTTKSKRVIFALHRSSEIVSETERKSHQGSTARLFSEIKCSFQEISAELQNGNFWRHHKAISPGLQEYIEALSFSKYLESQTLLSFEDVQKDLADVSNVRFITYFLNFFPLGIPYSDYLLGVSDLTGELMRFAITSVGSQGLSSRDAFVNALTICNFVRECKASWDPMSPYVPELKSKQEVTTASLRKIEEAVYSLSIRGLGDGRISNVNEVPIRQGNLEEYIQSSN